MITFTIDGQTVEVKKGATIIEAADQAGIYIPRFCYHPKLSIAANCRMCLVEVEGVKKPLPACATNAAANMKVYTKSKSALEAQRMVMEFLLINHPLDCPICDQGGECELQDLSLGFGWPDSEYGLKKRAVFNEDIGPLVETEMTRCIHCTRCVRFGEEIAGLPELGAAYRGEHMEIGTYVKHSMKSELSGNVIDLCPVGALISKPFLFRARGWELTEHPMISPHDCVGTNIFVHTRRDDSDRDSKAEVRSVMRVVPRQNESINEVWVSDRDRFSYEGLHAEDRVKQPLSKRNGEWVSSDWPYILAEIVDKLRAVLHQEGAEKIGALASPHSTVEELYLLQKFMRSLGSNNIDHRLREQDFRDQDFAPAFPNLGMKIADIEKCDALLLVGSFVRHEQPLINSRIFKATLEGAQVMAVNSIDYDFNYPLAYKMIVADDQLIESLAQIALALAPQDTRLKAFKEVAISAEAKAMAEKLKTSRKAAIFIGAHGLQHQHAASLRALVQCIGEFSGATVGILSEGANSAGAYLSGALPHRGPAGQKIEQVGVDAKNMLTTHPLKVYFLLNTEVEFDCAYAAAALKILDKAAMVVCLTPFVTEAMKKYADYILPVSPFTETSGTYVNVEGVWQSFRPASIPRGNSRPAWKVLRVLANLMKLPGFDHEDAQAVCQEMKTAVEHMPKMQETSSTMKIELPAEKPTLMRLGNWPMVRVDHIVRRAPAVNQAHLDSAKVFINENTAKSLHLEEGMKVTVRQENSHVKLQLAIDSHLADRVVYLPSGLKETEGFGQSFAPIEIE